MIDALGNSTHTRVSRIFPASPARLFQAWTDPMELRQWFAAGPQMRPALAEVDLRVGGRYRLGMQADGSDQVMIAHGEYREIAPPSRLVFTWKWESAPPDEPETLVTVEFHSRGESTEVVLLHERFTNTAQRDQHAAGWEGCFDHLLILIER